MINRAGGQIINGKKYWWTNWFYDQVYLGQPMFAIPDMVMPRDILNDMFGPKSAWLMPMPKEIWN